MRQSREVVFHMLLVAHGGDPEPECCKTTDKYNQWLDDLVGTLSESIEDDDIVLVVRDEFIDWCVLNGLHYDYEEDTRRAE